MMLRRTFLASVTAALASAVAVSRAASFSRTVQSRKLLTGIPEIDETIGGVREGDLWVHAAAPGELKSTLARTVAHNIASDGNQVLYVSLEETSEDLLRRFSALGPVPPNLHVFTPMGDTGIADVVLASSRIENIALVILDSAQLFASPVRDQVYFVERAHVITAVRELADRVPTMLLWSINRSGRAAAEGRGGVYAEGDKALPNNLMEAANTVTTTFVTQEDRNQHAVTFASLRNAQGNVPYRATLPVHRPEGRIGTSQT
jgi:predicted ATP-dependent serine protease